MPRAVVLGESLQEAGEVVGLERDVRVDFHNDVGLAVGQCLEPYMERPDDRPAPLDIGRRPTCDAPNPRKAALEIIEHCRRVVSGAVVDDHPARWER